MSPSGGTWLVLSSGDLERIRRHAEEIYPEECCGILVGRGAARAPGEVRVERTVAAANVAPRDRRRRYTIAPEVLLRVHREAREAGREVVGYYHSHPGSPARPSEHDQRHAWPGASYLIVALSAGRVAEIRSWRLSGDGGAFREEPWETHRRQSGNKTS